MTLSLHYFPPKNCVFGAEMNEIGYHENQSVKIFVKTSVLNHQWFCLDCLCFKVPIAQNDWIWSSLCQLFSKNRPCKKLNYGENPDLFLSFAFDFDFV